MNRRDFIQALMSLGIAAQVPLSLFLPQARAAANRLDAYDIDSVDILTQGRDGKDYDKTFSGDDLSVAIKLSLRTGKHEVLPVPIYSAHEVVAAADREKYFLLSQYGRQSAVLTPDWTLDKIISAPEGYEFRGHGVIMPDRQHLVVSLGMIDERDSDARQGMLAVYDTASTKLQSMVETGGNAPHDIKLNAAQTHLIVSHKEPFGFYAGKAYQSDEQDPAAKGKITALRLSDLKPDYHISTPGAAPVHIAVTDDNLVYAVSNGVLGAPSPATYELTSPLHPLEQTGQWDRVDPYPIVEYDLNNQAAREISIDLSRQRRSQSIAYNAYSGKVGAVFVYSNTIAIIDKNGNEDLYDTMAYRIDAPIGLKAIPGTPLMVIGGAYNDLSVIDTETMELVRHFPLALYRSSHITIA